MISALILSSLVSSQTYSRKNYFSDASCSGVLTLGLTNYVQTGACQNTAKQCSPVLVAGNATASLSVGCDSAPARDDASYYPGTFK